MKTRKMTGFTTKVLRSALFAGCIALGAQGTVIGTELTALGDSSAYTLTRVEAKGENTITKFEYDASTGTMNPVYYQINMKNVEYGTGDYQTVKTISTSLGDFTVTLNHPSSELPTTLDESISTGIYTYPTLYTQYGYDAIENLEGIFIENNSGYYGGAIGIDYGQHSALPTHKHEPVEIKNIKGDFIANRTNDYFSFGGAINDVVADSITGNFIGNYSYSISGSMVSGGGAIANSSIKTLKGDFIGNYSGSYGGGAIYNSKIDNLTGDFIGNYVIGKTDNNYSNNTQGGAIYLGEDGRGVDWGIDPSITLTNSSFYLNHATSENGEAKGGAIYMERGEITLNSVDGYTSVIAGNYTESSGVRDDNAIYMQASYILRNFNDVGIYIK